MNIFEIMQQAKAIKDKMEDAKKRLSSMQVEGSSGGGMVKVVMSCDYKILSVKLDDNLQGDIHVLEDLMKTAVNDALEKISDKVKENISSELGGLELPPDFKLPF